MYDAEYIRELTAARKANEVARALIKDHERTIVAQRAELDALRAELEIERQRAAHAEQWQQKNREMIDALEDKIAHLRAHVEAFVRSQAEVERLRIDDDARERLAAYAHEAWSGWMRYLFGCGTFNADGSWTMPTWAAARWQRQMQTPYADLPPAEQESDRTEADRMLAALGTAGAHEARRLWDETRCRVCGWPLAESADHGCVPGNCSQRPAPAVRADAGYEADTQRAELEKLRDGLRGWWAERRALCYVLSMDTATIAGQTLVEALTAIQQERDALRAEVAALRAEREATHDD